MLHLMNYRSGAKCSKISIRQYRYNKNQKYLGSKNVYSNPIAKSCPSSYALDAISEMGLNQWHKVDDVAEKTKKIMEEVIYLDYLTVWDNFYTQKATRNTTPDERLRKIILKLPYFQNNRLSSVAAEVEIKSENNEDWIRLNTACVISNSQNNQNYSRFKDILIFLISIFLRKAN